MEHVHVPNAAHHPQHRDMDEEWMHLDGDKVEEWMCKLFLDDINPDLSEATLRREASQYVRDKVLRAKVEVKHEKNDRKATGVLYFATWNAAARAKSSLRQERPPFVMLGGRPLHSVKDYKELKLHQMMCMECWMCKSCACLLFLSSIIFLCSGLELKTEQPMIAFTQQPMHYFDANVLSSGVSYTCGDLWGGAPSMDCVDDERACLGVADQLHPTSADVAAVERMQLERMQLERMQLERMQLERIHAFRHNSSRKLRSKGCWRVYTPWLRVVLHDGAEKKVRCAYKYGTRANTRFMQERSHDDAQTFIAAHPMGSGLRVWSLSTPRRCLVGVAEVTDLAFSTKHRTINVLVGIGLVVLCCGSCFLINLKRCITALNIPTNGGGASVMISFPHLC